jgi:hypothetical protein
VSLEQYRYHWEYLIALEIRFESICCNKVGSMMIVAWFVGGFEVNIVIVLVDNPVFIYKTMAEI